VFELALPFRGAYSLDAPSHLARRIAANIAKPAGAAAALKPPATIIRPMQRLPDDNRPMTAEQAATLKRSAQAAYELDAFKPNLTRAEADLRIAALAAKLKLLDGPPHSL
jgi:hypothetical protein